jgi:wyosine [tRNA(Phe)-imidazoG37] synthetase (radical SAM superfamily)
MLYAINKQDAKELTSTLELRSITPEETAALMKLSKKEIALRSEGLVVADDSGKVILDARKKYAQHFFPLSVTDYADAIYALERYGKPLPILSVDSHDVLRCDFSCQDCLSGHGKKLPVQNYPPGNYDLQLEFYKHMLAEIVKYSEKRGFVGVRFEQSGEGNPDFYKSRPELLDFAKKLGLGSVYVTTGSKMNNALRDSLLKNADFIRISFPGADRESYAHYSGQNKFTYEDSVENLQRIVDGRRKEGREKDLMIGARVALRPEHEGHYLNFAKTLKAIGIDALQIVKILVPENKKLEDFPINARTIAELGEVEKLDDGVFNVNLPHNLDYVHYSRDIRNMEEFPKKCFSARIQPVLAGKSLIVCTKSEVMYSKAFQLGTFQGNAGELEQFLSEKNVEDVAKNVPAECNSCCSIYDNLLLHSLQKTIRSTNSKLNFYEVIK